MADTIAQTQSGSHYNAVSALDSIGQISSEVDWEVVDVHV
jgi:hypothetical protein